MWERIKQIGWTPFLTAGFVLIVLAASVFFDFKLFTTFSAVKSDLGQAETLIPEQAEEISNLSQELEAARDEISDLKYDLLVSSNANDRQSDELDALRRDYTRLENIQEDVNEQLAKNICSNQITNVDYENVQSPSTQLLAFVYGFDNVQSASISARRQVWDDALSQIHVIDYVNETDGNEYSLYFMVYYDERGFEEGTFFIDGQCWVDSPYD